MKATLDSSKRWYVVRTNVRAEFKAAENLRRSGYEVYLPRKRVEKRNKRTNIYRELEEPLMVRYLFVGQPLFGADWYTLNNCQGVAGVLVADGVPAVVPFNLVEKIFIDETDMAYDDTRAARIHRKEEARTRKETVAMTFRAGMLTRVNDGPFKGFRAAVEEVTAQGQVKALIEIFGQLTATTFDPEQLTTEPLEKRRQIA